MGRTALGPQQKKECNEKKKSKKKLKASNYNSKARVLLRDMVIPYDCKREKAIFSNSQLESSDEPQFVNH